MPLPRFRLRTLMIAVAGAAAYLALLRSPIWGLILLVTGPVIGAMIQRSKGGRGILGGILGGIVETCGPLAAILAWTALMHPTSRSEGRMLVASLFALGFTGAWTGAVVGLWVWGLAEAVGRLRKNAPRFPQPPRSPCDSPGPRRGG